MLFVCLRKECKLREMKQIFQLRIRLGKNGRMRVKMELNNFRCKLNEIRILKSVISTGFADGRPCTGRYLDDAEFLAFIASLYWVTVKCAREYKVNISK